MKKVSRILIIVNLLLLLGYFNWSIFQKEQILKDGQLVLLQLAPVDPRSLMQGDYMSLNYKESGYHLRNWEEEIPPRGYAILKTDSNQVAQIVRLQESPEPMNDDELMMKYKIIDGRLFLGAESFFFEEGQDTIFEKAAYGGLKVDSKGESLLVGLYDADFQLIQPEKE